MKKSKKKKAMRKFATGATRDNDEQKLNYIGSLSPLVLKRFTQFMRDHNIKGGELKRDEANWKKGMPKQSYFESKARHYIDTWIIFEGYKEGDIEEMLCADLFNTQGHLHTILVEKLKKKKREKKPATISTIFTSKEMEQIAGGLISDKKIKEIINKRGQK